MTDATLRITFAGPLLTFQDGGRPGHMRFGASASGPMDPLSHAAANIALGNEPHATSIEISMGGLALECLEGMLSFAIAGGDFLVERAGEKISSWGVFSLQQGETLTVRAGKSGSWAYLAIAGSPETSKWLESSATHTMSGFGGGFIQSGQKINVTSTRLCDDRHGAIEQPDFLDQSNSIRVTMGPQDQHFADQSLATFKSETFALTNAFDRMGVRLSGPMLELAGALSIPSEPITKGSVQVAGDGVPTILLADHQTTGGYPKIATIVTDDIGRVSQMRAGDLIRFEPVSAEEAIQIARDMAAARKDYFAAIAEPKGTLDQRLMRENLISGATSGDSWIM